MKNVFGIIRAVTFVFVCAVVLFLPPICIFLINKSGCVDISGYVQIGCSTFTYYSTVIFSVLALCQNKKAHKLSQLVYIQSQREYFPSFVVQNVSYKLLKCKDDSCFHKINFCQVDVEIKKCEGLNITLTNCGEHPITRMHLEYIYDVGKKHKTESSGKDYDVIVAPEKSFSICVCDTPRLLSKGLYHTFDVTCYNMFGYSSTIHLEVQSANKTESEPLKYSCKIIKTGVLSADIEGGE